MSKVEQMVIARIEARAQLGLVKYGTSMERSDLTTVQWLRHAQEEAMDLAIYLERLIQEAVNAALQFPNEHGSGGLLQVHAGACSGSEAGEEAFGCRRTKGREDQAGEAEEERHEASARTRKGAGA